MATTTGETDNTPYGLWLGGLFKGAKRSVYRVKETNEAKPIQVGSIHINTDDVDDDKIRFRVDPNATLDLPTDKEILVNVRAWAKDRKVNYAHATDFAFMTAPEVARPDGELVPARGLMVVGRYLGLIQKRVRDWDNPAPNATRNERRLKFVMHLPEDVEHAEVDVPDDMTIPELVLHKAYLVPVSIAGTKQGLAYRLKSSFKPQPLDAAA